MQTQGFFEDGLEIRERETLFVGYFGGAGEGGVEGISFGLEARFCLRVGDHLVEDYADADGGSVGAWLSEIP